VEPAPPLKDEAERLKTIRKRWLVRYDSVCDQRVPGILAIPPAPGGRKPAVLLLAGSGGHKNTDYVRLTSDMLNTLGFITFAIDAQYHGDRARKGRSGDIHLVYDVTARDAFIQTVRDLRRAVDYLCSRPDVDKNRIGFVGFSQGGMIGGTFIGVEPRVRVACLAVPGGGFAEWARKAKMVSKNREGDLDIGAAMTDPIHFLGKFAPRPLLILAAKKDELIAPYATEAVYAAAGAGKKLLWYNSGHVLPPNAILIDAKQFFQSHLGSAKAR
jgi:dienelactone hydrolase